MSDRVAQRRVSALLVLLAAAFTGAACTEGSSAFSAFDRGDYTRSLNVALEAAREGDPAAINLVGVHYYVGAGVSRDFAEAGRWFRRAARLGDANAQCNLGMLYLRGLGVRQSKSLAYAWFLEAEKRGNPRATSYIAVMTDLLTPDQMERARHALDRELGQRTAVSADTK